MTPATGPVDLAAVARNSLGEATVDSIGEQIGWRGPPIGTDELPEHLLVMLFASRAGSTFAGDLLSGTPHFNRVGEFFNPRQLQRLREREGFADNPETLRWMIRRFGTPHAFGAKCGVPGLAGALATGFLEASFPRLRFLVLDRRDRVAQAVSLYRAELTGRFHARQQARGTIGPDDYNRAAIAERIGVIDRVYGMFDAFLARTGKSAARYWYEDVSDDPAGFVNAVCGDLGLDAPGDIDTEVRTTKLADDISAAWIARYRKGR